MSWEISCTDMCRACMQVDGVLLPMYGDDVISKKNLPDKLAELTSVKIDRYDGLPTMLCAKCAYRTDAFYEFRLQVQATEKKLRKMFETTIQPKIKEEVVEGKCEANDLSETDERIRSELVYSTQSFRCLNDRCKGIENEGTLEKSLNDVTNMCSSIDDLSVKVRETHIVENESAETERTDTAEDFNHIFIPEIRQISPEEQDKLRDIKNEVPDEITEIFQTQDLDYTIMYIPDNELDTVVQTDSGNIFMHDNETNTDSVESNHDNIFISACAPEVLIETEDDDNDLTRIQSSVPTDFDGCRSTNVGNKCWQTSFPFGIVVNGVDSENDVKKAKNPKESENFGESDSEDSDYFVDPKDNILGSLNDTIMKIKEIKLENKTIQYQCTLCMQNYEKLTGVLIHTVDNHVPGTGPFFCMVCEKDCESHRQLRTHVKAHTGQFPYTCFICSKAYSMKRYLKRHMTCHTDFPRYRCPKCGVRFKTKSELEFHISTHIQGAPYACSQCPRVFNHKGNYKRHLITHLDPQGLHLPKYPCKICGKRFLNNRTLETHMRVHTGEKPFKCEVCNRSFSQQGNLLNHLRIHSNPRSYTCEVCGKRFNQRATLKDHSLLHTGEKPYVCNVCGVAFTFSAALRRHMWTHAGGKPFGCEICNARFVGKYDLKRHMSVHSDKPKLKRKRNQTKRDTDNLEESKEQSTVIQEIPDTETILIEQVLLNQDATQIIPQEESEKENVDALFNLIQYGQ